MKKTIFAAAFLLMSLCFGERLSAGNYGILGGAGFYTYSPKNIGTRTVTQWHAGLVYKHTLPFGFQIQPALLYNVKEATTDNTSLDLSVGYLELQASVQWGADLILFRPYVEVTPFAGYGLNGWGSMKDVWKSKGNRWEYGVGVGAGLQIWRFQLSARYNWNFAKFMPASEKSDRSGEADFSGVTLSLAYFF